MIRLRETGKTKGDCAQRGTLGTVRASYQNIGHTSSLLDQQRSAVLQAPIDRLQEAAADMAVAIAASAAALQHAVITS